MLRQWCRIVLSLSIAGGLASVNISALAAAAKSTPTTETTSAVVTMQSVATVTGPDILLGEIAQIDTPDAELATKLRSLPVGKAALAGSERTLFTGSILVRLRQAGIAESAVRLVAQSDAIVVRTAAAVVRAAELEQVAQEAVLAALIGRVKAPLPPNAAATCPSLPDVPVTSGASYEIRLAGTVLFAPLSDQVTVPLAVWSTGRLQQQISARCIVNAEAEVAVLTRKMDRYEPLRPGDIRWERRNLASRPLGVVTRSAEATMANWRMIYPQEAGVELTWEMIQAQPHAFANDEVELVSIVGAVRIVDTGRLVKDARIGEVVEVKNSRTGAVVTGTLTEPKRVTIIVN